MEVGEQSIIQPDIFKTLEHIIAFTWRLITIRTLKIELKSERSVFWFNIINYSTNIRFKNQDKSVLLRIEINSNVKANNKNIFTSC